MTFYEEMADLAGELLGEFNQGVITITKPGSEQPGENPWDPPVIIDEQVIPLKATAKAVSEAFINGTTIVATDIEITAADFGAQLDSADELAVDGKVVNVIKIMRIPAAGTLIAWKFIVRD